MNADNWEIDACPTNAAAVAAKGDHVAVAWFTGAQDMPRELMAFSNDSGSSFTKPVTLSTGHAFGYTAMAMDEDGGAIVSWLEQNPAGARVLVRRVTAAGVAGPIVEVAKGGKMALGYPKLFHNGSDTFIAWGNPKHVRDGESDEVRAAQLLSRGHGNHVPFLAGRLVIADQASGANHTGPQHQR